MKVLFFTLVLFSSLSNASVETNESLKGCNNTQAYLDNDWIIHNPKHFNKILKKQSRLISTGLEDGSVEEDLNGTIRTYNAIGGRPVLMKVETFDSLNTDRDLMYGDFAVMVKHFSPEQSLEVRWFDGKQKHVVINSKYMSCISTSVPIAENTIF